MKQVGPQLWLKQALDRVVAGGLLVATGPVLTAAAIGVVATIGRPIFFVQQRPGRGGRPFRLFKLRTMSDERDADGRLLPDEHRLRGFGRFLRATSIDDLPNLLNVITGELSLVGPRPLLVSYLPLYTPEQGRRHDVLPGITGWAQIHGRNAISHEERFRLDVWYVDNWSLLLDLKILVQTALVVLGRRGVSAERHATKEMWSGNAEGDFRDR
jgi:lipopolysaccharide/colanic/teichoic acid biosynthesis glycosyltransferase